LPWLEVVWFWDVALLNVDGLYALKSLKRFGVHPKRPPVDFSQFQNLREVIVEPRKHDRGLATLEHVELLHIWHFKPSTGTFQSLEFPRSITELQINWANVKTLDSLPPLPHLTRLEVHRCRNLESLGNLADRFPCLQHLVVDSCGKVPKSEGQRAVSEVSTLKHVFVQGFKAGAGAA